jgi:hypothetical protein
MLVVRIVFVIISLILFLWSYSSYLQSKKPIIKFIGRIKDASCVQKTIGSRSSKQKYKYGFSTEHTTYNTETNCTLHIKYNKKKFNKSLKKGTDSILLRNVTGGPYLKGQPIKLESINTNKKNIQLCCTNYLINAIAIGIFGLILLGSAVFSKLDFRVEK